MALTPTQTAIQTKLGKITLPPTPSPASGGNLTAHQQAVSVWTRKAQQSITQIVQTLSALDTSLIPAGTGGGGGVYWTQALFDAAFAAKTTDNLAEGVDNLYWSQTLFDTAFAAKTTDALPQGSTNLYWSASLFSTAFAAAFPTAFSSAFATAFAAETTDNLAQGSTNLYYPSTKQTRSIVLCSAFTPTATGADVAEVEIPFSTTSGSLTYTIQRLLVRVQTAGGAPSVTFEKSTGSGAFSPTTIGTVTLTSGANEGQVTTSLGTIISGNKVRFNVAALGSAQNFTCQVDISVN